MNAPSVEGRVALFGPLFAVPIMPCLRAVQDDWDSWSRLTAAIGKDVQVCIKLVRTSMYTRSPSRPQIVGDDLTVTNIKRIAQVPSRVCVCIRQH